jgi:hypothetical protein
MANRVYGIRNNWPIGSATSEKQVFENLRPYCCCVGQNIGTVKRATGTCHKMFIYDLTLVRLRQVSVLMFVILFIYYTFLIFSVWRSCIFLQYHYNLWWWLLSPNMSDHMLTFPENCFTIWSIWKLLLAFYNTITTMWYLIFSFL